MRPDATLTNTLSHCTVGNLGGLDRQQVEAIYFWSHFLGFLGVNWSQSLLEACLSPSYTRGRPLQPLELLLTLLEM